MAGHYHQDDIGLSSLLMMNGVIVCYGHYVGVYIEARVINIMSWHRIAGIGEALLLPLLLLAIMVHCGEWRMLAMP